MSRDGVYRRKGRQGFTVTYKNEKGKRVYEKVAAPTLQQARMIRSTRVAEVEKRKALGYSAPPEATLTTTSRSILSTRSRASQRPPTCARRASWRSTLSRSSARCYWTRSSEGDVIGYITARSRKKVSNGTVLREWNILKHFFKMAVYDAQIKTNPCDMVKAPKAPAAASGIFSQEN